MFRFSLIALTGLISSATAGGQPVPSLPEHPNILVRTEHNTYEVEGRTERQLEASIAERGPGRSIVSFTEYSVLPELGFDQTDTGCSLGDVYIAISYDLTYPHWVDADEARQSLQENWRTRLNAMEVHEHGHVRLTWESTRVLFEQLQALPEMQTCRDLQRAIQSISRSASRELARVQQDYDFTTRQGRTQSAWEWEGVETRFGGEP